MRFQSIVLNRLKKRYMNDYIQYVTSDFLAGLGFGATPIVGDFRELFEI